MDGHVRNKSYYLLIFPIAAASKTVIFPMKTLLVQSTSSNKAGQHFYKWLLNSFFLNWLHQANLKLPYRGEDYQDQTGLCCSYVRQDDIYRKLNLLWKIYSLTFIPQYFLRFLRSFLLNSWSWRKNVFLCKTFWKRNLFDFLSYLDSNIAWNYQKCSLWKV